MRGDVYKRIRAELERDPKQRNVDIIAKLGCCGASVSNVRARMGLPSSWGLPRSRSVMVHADNMTFLQDEAAQSDVTVEAMLNAIITDARLEAEDEQAG